MDKIKKLLQKEIIRYAVAGACTTAVNFVSFFILRLITDLSRSVVSIISISLAILFAFFVNKFFVFVSEKKSMWVIAREFCSFVGVRLFAMLVEVIGTNLLCDSFRYNEFISKILIQFVVLVLNYIFSKCFVFKENKNSVREYFKENYIIILSFIIPAVFLLGIWIAEGIGPFGGHSLTMVDSLHQYLPFFSDYYDKLTNEGSLFYTWNIGLGSNMLAIIAYYIACPLNFIVVIFGKSHLYIAMCLLIGIKIALSGMTFASYAAYKCKDKHSLGIVIFSVAYALSNYVIGYSWNLMWMDCIMILPLIMKGYDKMTEEGDIKLYTFSLFYGLLCNYYICFMICIFLVLQFFLTNHHKVKKFFTDGLRFAGSSILAAAMAAFILIPAYLGLNTTASAKRVLPEANWYGSIWDMFKQMFFVTSPIKSQQFDGGVNLYCGSICMILLFVYLLNTKIKLMDKIRNVLLLAFLMVSFNNELLNYIWHGFHNQYGIPNRFSFLFIFVLLALSCEAFHKLDKIELTGVLFAIAMSFGFIIICGKNISFENSSIHYSESASVGEKFVYMMQSNIMLCTEILLAIYSVALIAIKVTKGRGKQIVTVILVCICLVETIINGACGYNSNGYVNMEQYFGDEEALEAAIDSLDCKDKEYRMEFVNTTVVDEAIYYNIKSVSLFGSTVSNNLVNAMHGLGFYTGANEFLFDGANPVSMSVLGIRYLFRRDKEYNPYDVELIGTVSGIDIYQNKYALSTGFMVNDSLLDWDKSGNNMFDSVNAFVEKATGVAGVFSQLYPEVTPSGANSEITHNGALSEWYSFEKTSTDAATFRLSFDITEESNDIYIIANSSGINKIRIYINDVEENYERLQNQTYHVGHLVRGDKVTVEYCFRDKQPESGSLRLAVATFNQDAFEKAYSIMSENQMNVKTFEDGYVEGTITLKDDGIMFTSIPYDKGWTVYVDGEETDIKTVAGAFIAVPLKAGGHTIEFDYYPPGLKLGFSISILGWIIMTLLITSKGKKGKNTIPVEKKTDDEVQNAEISNEG
ncbi:MAG: YfhO family protein [Coprococcus sp.]